MPSLIFVAHASSIQNDSAGAIQSGIVDAENDAQRMKQALEALTTAFRTAIGTVRRMEHHSTDVEGSSRALSGAIDGFLRGSQLRVC